MPAAKLDPEGWNEIRKAYEAGVDDETLSQDFGVSRVALRQRRKREAWVSPARIRLEAQKKALELKARSVSNATKVTDVTAEDSVAGFLARKGEEASRDGIAILAAKLRKAMLNPESVAEIETVAEVALAAKAARSIAGLDRPETAVQINLASVWGGVGSANSPGEAPVLLEDRA